MPIDPLDPHPSDDVLELYSLHQLKEEKLEALEEHLMVCRECQNRLATQEKFISAIREACRDVILSPPPARFPLWSIRSAIPLSAGAFAIAAIFLSSVLVTNRPANGVETEIQLMSSRGGGSATKANANLRLRVDKSELGSLEVCRLAIVDMNGREVWATHAKPGDTGVSVRVPVALEHAKYWVRVSGSEGEPIREFALDLQ